MTNPNREQLCSRIAQEHTGANAALADTKHNNKQRLDIEAARNKRNNEATVI